MTDATGRVISAGDIVYYQLFYINELGRIQPPWRLVICEPSRGRRNRGLVEVRRPDGQGSSVLMAPADLWPTARQAADAAVAEARAALAAWQRHAISIPA